MLMVESFFRSFSRSSRESSEASDRSCADHSIFAFSSPSDWARKKPVIPAFPSASVVKPVLGDR
jgi:hypothetical protein